MKAKKKVLGRVIAIALAVIVGAGMIAPANVSAASSSSNKPGTVSLTSVYRYDHDAIKIKWKTASKADYYQVYRATKSKGTYSRVASVEGTSYVNKKLTTGKTYYYKVRAVNKVGSKSYVGTFSKYKSAKPYLSKGSISKVTSNTYGAKYATVTFNKVNGASGYQVYQSTSKNGTYKKVNATFTNNGDGTYKAKTKSSLKADTLYYFKVRAYKKLSNGNYSYGSFSNYKYHKTGEHHHNFYKTYNSAGKHTGYKCSCGLTRNVSHTHMWEDISGTTVKGCITSVYETKTVSYCSACDTVISELPSKHLANVHAGEDLDFIACGKYSVQVSHNEFVKRTVSNGFLYNECLVCHKKSHQHSWEAMYEDGHYAYVKVPVYSYYCSACGCYGGDMSCEDFHKANGEKTTYTFKATGSKKTIKAWISEKTLMGYECSTCGEKMNNKHATEYITGLE